MRRNPQARFFTLILPLLFLVILTSVFGNNRVGPQHVRSATYYVPGLCALGIVAASFVNLVISITAQRERGILKRRRATPVPALVLIAGRTLTAVGISLVNLALLLAVGRVAYGVSVPVRGLPAVALTAVCGSVCFCVLAYALTTAVNSEDAAQPMVQAVMLPLYFISGVFVPNVILPSWLRTIAEIFPAAAPLRRAPPRPQPGRSRQRHRLQRPRRARPLGAGRARARAAPLQLDTSRSLTGLAQRRGGTRAARPYSRSQSRCSRQRGRDARRAPEAPRVVRDTQVAGSCTTT